MNPRFPGIGTFALIDGEWHEIASTLLSCGQPVRVVFDDRRAFEAWRPVGEVDRRWTLTRGSVALPLERVDRIVRVERVGSYRNSKVDQRGPVDEGLVWVSLSSNDPQEAHSLEFSGHERDGFDKRISVGELENVSEIIEVEYERKELPHG